MVQVNLNSSEREDVNILHLYVMAFYLIPIKIEYTI